MNIRKDKNHAKTSKSKKQPKTLLIGAIILGVIALVFIIMGIPKLTVLLALIGLCMCIFWYLDKDFYRDDPPSDS